jgi:hypothetical protein
LILEKNQFLVIDYLLNKADSYKDLKIEWEKLFFFFF